MKLTAETDDQKTSVWTELLEIRNLQTPTEFEHTHTHTHTHTLCSRKWTRPVCMSVVNDTNIFNKAGDALHCNSIVATLIFFYFSILF